MSKQISAVEWYENRIFILQIQLEKKEISLGEYSVTRVELFKQAKEMEKEQIEDFFNAGVRYGSGSVMSTEWGEDTEEYNFEQYYNETFKSE